MNEIQWNVAMGVLNWIELNQIEILLTSPVIIRKSFPRCTKAGRSLTLDAICCIPCPISSMNP